jgi:enoyl-CoA hydratase/carnithine racemase
MALIKESLEGSFEMSLKEALEWEASHQAIMAQTDEVQKAARRFFKSRWKG